MSLDVTDVPKIMRANKQWTVAPAFLERWLKGASMIAPNYAQPLETLDIAWILSSPQYRGVFNAAWGKRRWMTPNARAEIVNTIVKNRQGQIIGPQGRGGEFLSKSFIAETGKRNWTSDPSWKDHYIQHLAISCKNFQIDEQVGAVGSVTFYFLVNGEARPFKPFPPWHAVFEMIIKSVGFFVNDSFDFNDSGKLSDVPVADHFSSQHLGWWSQNPPHVWAHPRLGFDGTHMDNKRFRDWRSANGLGADFLIGTQTRWIELERPDSFQVWFRSDGTYNVI